MQHDLPAPDVPVWTRLQLAPRTVGALLVRLEQHADIGLWAADLLMHLNLRGDPVGDIDLVAPTVRELMDLPDSQDEPRDPVAPDGAIAFGRVRKRALGELGYHVVPQRAAFEVVCQARSSVGYGETIVFAHRPILSRDSRYRVFTLHCTQDGALELDATIAEDWRELWTHYRVAFAVRRR